MRLHTHRVFWGLLFIGVSGLAIAVLLLNNSEPAVMSNRSKWEAKGSDSYMLSIETMAPPVAPIGLQLSVKANTIINRTVLACKNSSEEYSPSDCERINTYYNHTGNYTIIDLFNVAETCTAQTIASLTKCSAFSINNFYGFENVNAMWEANQVCEASIDYSDLLCFVEYHPDYGYPQTIIWFTPDVDDGSTVITVKNVELN